jgi:hypothetical protein
MVVVLTLAVIGVAIIRFASREVAGATAGERQQALIACADAGRQLMQSQFTALGAAPLSFAPMNVALDSAGSTRAVGGHYDEVSVTQLAVLPETSFGPAPADDLTNRIVSSGGNSGPMKMVVHCQQGGDGTPGSGRQLEVEVGMRFGF